MPGQSTLSYKQRLKQAWFEDELSPAPPVKIEQSPAVGQNGDGHFTVGQNGNRHFPAICTTLSPVVGQIGDAHFAEAGKIDEDRNSPTIDPIGMGYFPTTGQIGYKQFPAVGKSVDGHSAVDQIRYKHSSSIGEIRYKYSPAIGQMGYKYSPAVDQMGYNHSSVVSQMGYSPIIDQIGYNHYSAVGQMDYKYFPADGQIGNEHYPTEPDKFDVRNGKMRHLPIQNQMEKTNGLSFLSALLEGKIDLSSHVIGLLKSQSSVHSMATSSLNLISSLCSSISASSSTSPSLATTMISPSASTTSSIDSSDNTNAAKCREYREKNKIIKRQVLATNIKNVLSVKLLFLFHLT